MKDTLTILKDAYALIRNKDRWTRAVSARNAAGDCVTPWNEDAVRFCAAGAIWQVSGIDMNDVNAPLVHKAFKVLTVALDGRPISAVNDGPAGYELVCAAYRKAIADLTPTRERTVEEPVGAGAP